MSIEYHMSLWKKSSALTSGALTVVATLAMAPLGVQSGYSQTLTSGDLSAPGIEENARLLLIADELTYNQDSNLIIADGGVQIDYGSYQLVAQQVEYNQKTGTVRAIGEVELLEPSGNRIYADELDVTDDFAEGFIKSLRVETPQEALITAETAERIGGEVSVFRNGTYNGCPQCVADTSKAPRWKVKVRKIVRNSTEKTLTIREPVISLYDKPVLKLPTMTIPELTSGRKSGFLAPSVGYDEKLGWNARVPYYFALAPNMDATVTASGFTKAGFMAEGEFRQKFNSGTHTLRFAGAAQTNPAHFDSVAGRATTDGAVRQRGFIASKGEFQLNSKWKLGWNGMLQSDQNFANTYSIDGYSSSRFANQAYLTGLGTTSYFDLHAYKFDVQSNVIGDQTESQQAIVYPVIDYSRIFSAGEYGGDLTLTMNGQNLSRDVQQLSSGRAVGLDGSNGRFTTELEWKKQIVTEGGFVFTPILAARGDYHRFNVNTTPAGLTSGSNATRGMLTAGFEAKYPILATTATSTHVFEPIAQIFARTDERLSGGLPNEDAQSFVFDAANLFARDKFSGFDRMEGGTRANVGFRYSATYANGFTTSATFGQSFHLAGKNSFAQTDLTGAGADSGLETNRSDYVGAVTLGSDVGLALTASGRFDKDNFAVNRSALTASYSDEVLSASLTHARIKKQTGYGSTTDREEISAAGSWKFADEWTALANTTFDIDAGNFTTTSSSLIYENTFSKVKGTYTRTHATATNAASWSLNFDWTFKTFGRLEFDELVFE